MKLADVYHREDAAKVLYQLLEEREPHQNISHKRMPSWAEHSEFFYSAPYTAWYLVLTEIGDVAGAIYLSKRDEIGVALFKQYWGKGIGKQAIRELMRLHPRRQFLANVAPQNERSAGMFRSLGFHHLQNTFARET